MCLSLCYFNPLLLLGVGPSQPGWLNNRTKNEKLTFVKLCPPTGHFDNTFCHQNFRKHICTFSCSHSGVSSKNKIHHQIVLIFARLCICDFCCGNVGRQLGGGVICVALPWLTGGHWFSPLPSRPSWLVWSSPWPPSGSVLVVAGAILGWHGQESGAK